MRVKGRGPVPCRVMVIGEAPGEVEEATGIPFHPYAPSGRELTRGLAEAGLRRSDVFLRNVLEWRPPNNRDPKPEEIAEARPGLLADLDRVRPEILVTVGAVATHQFLTPPMEYVQGLLFARQAWVVAPIYHPAYALRQPAFFYSFLEGLRQVGRYLRGEAVPYWKADPVRPNYREVTTPAIDPVPAIGIDTEASGEWGLTLAAAPGHAWAIRAGSAAGIAFANAHVRHARTIYLHSCLHDLPVLAAMGVPIPPEKIVDTEILAALLHPGVAADVAGEGKSKGGPRGLKTLAYRLAGMGLSTYKAVSAPLDAAQVRGWIEAALPRVRVAGRQRALNRAYFSDDPRGTLRRSKFTKDLPVPPFVLPWSDTTIQYGCGDADATLRIGPILQRQIHEAGLDACAALDHGVIALVARMAARGLGIHPQRLAVVDREMRAEIDRLTRALRRRAWAGFNPRAHQQVEAFLYDWEDLPVVRHTKGGRRSTDEKTLSRLQHEGIDLLMDLRELEKLRSTYVEALTCPSD